MNIRIFDTLEDLPEPHPAGAYVVIDAFKFATTVCVLLENGADSVTPLNSKSECREFKANHPDALVGGEMTRENEPQGEFDLGNSPTYVETLDVDGARIGLHSDNGAEAVRELTTDEPIYLGSTVNAASVAVRLRESGHTTINLLAAGRNGHTAIEDMVTASLIHRYLNTATVPPSELRLYRELVESAARDEARSGKIAADEDFERVRQLNTSDVIPRMREGEFVDSSQL